MKECPDSPDYSILDSKRESRGIDSTEGFGPVTLHRT